MRRLVGVSLLIASAMVYGYVIVGFQPAIAASGLFGVRGLLAHWPLALKITFWMIVGSVLLASGVRMLSGIQKKSS
jgi:hypothetical protein